MPHSKYNKLIPRESENYLKVVLGNEMSCLLARGIKYPTCLYLLPDCYRVNSVGLLPLLFSSFLWAPCAAAPPPPHLTSPHLKHLPDSVTKSADSCWQWRMRLSNLWPRMIWCKPALGWSGITHMVVPLYWTLSSAARKRPDCHFISFL